MNVLVVQHLVTLTEAARIVRFFKQKKHSGLGYFFELNDLGATMLKATSMPGLRPYRGGIIDLAPGSSWWREDAYLLQVYREKSRPGAAEPPITKAEVDAQAPPTLSPDEVRVLKGFAQHLLEVERSGGVSLN